MTPVYCVVLRAYSMFDPKKDLASKTIAADMDRDGFAVVEFPDTELDRLADDIWQSLQPHFDWASWKAGTAPGVRVPDAWTVNESVRKIATNSVTRGAKPVHFLPKKGQALIWDANLLHGGAPQTDRSLTRHSQVTHYFFEGCSYFTPLTGASRQPAAIEPPQFVAL